MIIIIKWKSFTSGRSKHIWNTTSDFKIYSFYAPPPRRPKQWCCLTSDVCLTTSVAYIVNIHRAHSHWKQGVLDAAGVMHVWAGAGPQRAAYRAGAYRGGRPPTACISNLVLLTPVGGKRHVSFCYSSDRAWSANNPLYSVYIPPISYLSYIWRVTKFFLYEYTNTCISCRVVKDTCWRTLFRLEPVAEVMYILTTTSRGRPMSASVCCYLQYINYVVLFVAASGSRR